MADVLFMAITLGLTYVPQLLAITWSLAAWKNYYSGIDVIWPLLLALLAAGYSLFIPGYAFRKVILVVLVTAWAIRLSVHLALRLKATFPKEDPRYDLLKRKWGANQTRNFFIFYQLQGIAAIVLAFPFWVYLMNPSQWMHWTEILGILLFVAALAGETMADEQLRRFKAKSENKGKALQTGLWKYSRHPNYFCEWMIWVSFTVMAISAPRSGLALFAPALILVALLRWTGVPATEAQTDQSRGESYREYRKNTNAFFPWFPKNEMPKWLLPKGASANR